MRGLSLLLILVAVVVASVATVALYYAATQGALKLAQEAEEKPGIIMVEEVRAGRGFIEIFVRSVNTQGKVDTIYFLKPDGTPLYTYKLPYTAKLEEGRLTKIVIPCILMEVMPKGEVVIALGTAKGITARSARTIDVSRAVETGRTVYVGLLADRSDGCRGEIYVSTSLQHGVVVNLLTGEYSFKYVGGNDIRTATGRAKVLWQDTLDLSRMSWNERYALGPVVIFVNPTYATRDYEVKIINIGGGVYVAHLAKLVSSAEEVAFDGLVAWEDLWWPGTSASLDNYIDHVVRVTIFTNNTVRVEVLHASGCYLHGFYLDPSNFEEMQNLAVKAVNGELVGKERTSIVYVKPHGNAVPGTPPLNTVLDPYTWSSISFPVIFYR